MGIRGDTGRLHSLTASLAKLGDGEAVRRMAKGMSAEGLSLVMEGFVQSKDPYGRPWKRILRPGRILRKTNRLMSSFTSHPTAHGFVVETNVGYAGFHQRGTKFIAQRMMVPEGKLGAWWKKALAEVAHDQMREELKS